MEDPRSRNCPHPLDELLFVAISAITSGAEDRVTVASGSWAGSVNGMGMGLDIVNGVAVASLAVVSGVPEPESYALLPAGLGVLAFRVQRQSWRKQ